jgi:L1 cell adhesion molecule like protein
MAELARTIQEAVKTVLKNRDNCVEIGKRAKKVSTLVSQLQDAKMEDEPAMRHALETLLATFHCARLLVFACQRRSLVIGCLSSPRAQLSKQLHEVLDQIASNIADMTAIVLP